MLDEIEKATDFLFSFIRHSVPEVNAKEFKETLSHLLHMKFSSRSWSSEYPDLGSAYRAIFVTSGKLDPILLNAAKEASIPSDHLRRYLPKEFVLWVDPGSVSYRIGEHGSIAVCHESQSYIPNTFVACAELMNSRNISLAR